MAWLLGWGVLLSELKFDRKPYTVQYQRDGVTHKIKRMPPPKLHDLVVEDKVTITRAKSDFWAEDEDAKIVRISPRQPNSVQIEKDGKKTTVPYFDVKFVGNDNLRIAEEDELAIKRDPLGSKYLLWP